ncbi:MAG TPA: response regulator transcription factor [Terriglobales bacterium]|nr:response regulator transcription factor [Terriglobales bacterium]
MGSSAAISKAISVLVADSNHMQSQLLASALRRRPEFRVSSCELTHNAVLTAVAAHPTNVALMNAEKDMSVMRSLHLAHPHVRKVLLVESSNRNTVTNAFRAGARGLFCFTESPFRLLCKCIHCVHEGQLWICNQQLEYLVETVAQVPSLRVVNNNGFNLLTAREEQVVALVADGLTNRDVARELGLTENTVKKYLFHIFDKVGVSSRVELVLYAVTRGAVQNAEWVPAAMPQ